MLKICGPMTKKRFEELQQDTTFLCVRVESARHQPRRLRNLLMLTSCSRRGTRYQTVHLCHACSQKLAPRHGASSAKTEESRGPDTTTGTTSSSAAAAVVIAPKPPDTQSAHALFWGRMERKAKAASATQHPKVKPFSADIPRVRFQRNSSKSTHSSKQYLRHLTHLLPVVVSKTQAKGTFPDCLERLARHLQRKYHRASVRFALAQCNVFPIDPIVPTSVLCLVCGPELTAAISAYVRLVSGTMWMEEVVGGRG